jgi:hypothetical protein
MGLRHAIWRFPTPWSAGRIRGYYRIVIIPGTAMTPMTRVSEGARVLVSGKGGQNPSTKTRRICALKPNLKASAHAPIGTRLATSAYGRLHQWC